jgi:uncharacterized membrane protein
MILSQTKISVANWGLICFMAFRSGLHSSLVALSSWMVQEEILQLHFIFLSSKELEHSQLSHFLIHIDVVLPR